VTNDDALRWYLQSAAGRRSDRDLVSAAQDCLAGDDVPAWVTEIALLDPQSADRAHALLAKHLHDQDLLPSSRRLRQAIAALILDLADEIEALPLAAVDKPLRQLRRLLSMLDTYMCDSQIPIVEYPYPPHVFTVPKTIAAYIREHEAEWAQL